MSTSQSIAIGDIIDGERVVWVASDGSGFETERIR